MPINSPRRGELNGLREKFSRRCFSTVVATVSIRQNFTRPHTLSLPAWKKTSFFFLETRGHRGLTENRIFLSSLIASRSSILSKRESRRYLSSPHFSNYSTRSNFFFLPLVRPGASIGAKAGRDSYSRALDGNGRKCIAFAMNCRLSSFSSRICIRMQSTLIDRRRATSRQRLIRLY